MEEAKSSPRAAADARQGAKQHNEDAFLLFQSPGGRLVAGGVFDGHGGLNGRLAASVARDTALAFFEALGDVGTGFSESQWKTKLEDLFAGMQTAIREAFLRQDPVARGPAPRRAYRKDPELKRSDSPPGSVLHDDRGVVRRHNGYPVHGGTTATLCVVLALEDGSKSVVCANVGDSDAILFFSDNRWKRLSVVGLLC
jgi:serine/threonine protein phosphatase PrpC